MHGGDLVLENLILVLAVAVAIVAMFHRLRLPTLAGYVLAGVLVGPHGIGLIRNPDEIEDLANIGVVLLLFSIGLEFSIARLRRMWKVLLEAGVPYLALTAGAGAVGARTLGLTWPEAVFAGFWIGLSSTAVVLKSLSDRGEVDAPHGRLILSIQLFQDLALVPMMLFLPLLAGLRPTMGNSILPVLLEALAILLAVLLFSRLVVPPFLAWVVRTRNRELFLLLVLLLCLGTAAVAGRLGLSTALGAFLGGLLLSKSDYGIQALSDVLPFRDVFNAVFLMSIGMLFSVDALLAAPLVVLALTAAIIGGKALIGFLVAAALRFPARVALLAGVALAQMGEFSFVLAEMGRRLELMDPDLFQVMLAATVLSMAVTPVFIAFAPRVADRVERAAGRSPLLSGRRTAAEAEAAGLTGHVVIAGYGVNGRNLARLFSEESIPHLVVEMNARAVAQARANGEPVIYGDISGEHMVKHVGLDRARALVLTIPDADAARRTVARARHAHPDLYILVRTRYLLEVDELHALGADEVVPEEFETSMEMAARALARLGVAPERIRRRLDEVRSGRYRALRSLSEPAVPARARPTDAGAVETRTLIVPVGSPADGLSLQELRFEAITGALVLAIIREGHTLATPPGSTVLHAGDALAALGSEDQLDAARAVLDGEIVVGPDD